VDRDEAAPLIGCDLPEFKRALPTIGTDCSWPYAGIVDQDVDATKPIAGGLGDLLGRGIGGQILLQS
jgi:hypothetical protein